jgi:phage-related protein (TIGR01555 family)
MVLSTDLSTMLQPGTATSLLARATLFNALRDNQNLMIVNKTTEDFKNVSASIAGLDDLQAQAQEHVASTGRVPLVKYTGLQPKGLNASAEGEIAVYDDTIMAYQNRFIRPNLTTVFNFMQLSLWGEIDPEITFEFEPLRVMTEKERSEKQKADAERDGMRLDQGAISPERSARSSSAIRTCRTRTSTRTKMPGTARRTLRIRIKIRTATVEQSSGASESANANGAMIRQGEEAGRRGVRTRQNTGGGE